MRELHMKYPNDNDAASLFAESMMNTMPWDYWLDPENPKPLTMEVLAALETVLERNPEHPLAIHLYIHAVEASSSPERAEAPADAPSPRPRPTSRAERRPPELVPDYDDDSVHDESPPHSSDCNDY